LEVLEDKMTTLDLLVYRLAERLCQRVYPNWYWPEPSGTKPCPPAWAADRSPVRTPAISVEVPSLFLEAVTVEGFRGIPDRARLGLWPGPGLTLVVGRNGSGKSSFAAAAELALTGASSRWQRRSKVWEEGWACLHHDGSRSVEVRILTDGLAGLTMIRRRWAAADGLADSTASPAPRRTGTVGAGPAWYRLSATCHHDTYELPRPPEELINLADIVDTLVQRGV
jgi:hypothetical protein